MDSAAPKGWDGTFGRICAAAAVLSAVLLVSAARPAEASQRPRDVVAISCTTDMDLCRALVQAMAELAPSHIYRINPDPMPPQAFRLRLDLSDTGRARLHWQEGGHGDVVARTGLTETDLARKLVASSPGLARALGAQR